MVVTANRLPSIQAPNQVDRTFNESNAPTASTWSDYNGF